MRQFIDVTARTEDEAIQNALRQLAWTGTMCPLRFWSEQSPVSWVWAARPRSG